MVRSDKLWFRGGQGCITIWELNLALCKSLPHVLALVASGMQDWPGHGEKLKLVRVLVTVQPWLQRRPQHINHARTLEGPQRKVASKEWSRP